jgi:prepilin-type processing-associated H-X9-DG protein
VHTRVSPPWTGSMEDAPIGTRILSWASQTAMNSIKDGSSNTLLVGEKHIRPNSLNGKNEDRSIFASGNANNYRRLAGLQPNGNQRPIVADPFDQNGPLVNSRFGSAHKGVCQFVFCDGSVRTVRNNVDLTTLTRLALRADGLPTGNDY